MDENHLEKSLCTVPRPVQALGKGRCALAVQLPCLVHDLGKIVLLHTVLKDRWYLPPTQGLSVLLRPVSLVGNDPIVRKSVLDVYMNKRYDTIKTAEKELTNDAG